LLALVISAGSMAMSSCKYSKKATDDTEAVTTEAAEETFDIPDIPDEMTEAVTEPPEPEYYKITQTGSKYGYRLFDKEGNVVAEDAGFVDKPEIVPVDVMEGLVFKVTAERTTFYYNYDTDELSERHFDVYDQQAKLIVKGDFDRIVVCGIFGHEYYREIADFTYPLYTDDRAPFVSCGFVDGGAAVNVVYRSWDSSQWAVFERSECISLANDKRYVIVPDWEMELETVSEEERDDNISFLTWHMGTYDYNTGYNLTYDVTGKIRVNGTLFYHCECYYIMVGDDGAESLVRSAEFMLSADKQERYDCRETDGYMEIYTNDNMI